MPEVGFHASLKSHLPSYLQPFLSRGLQLTHDPSLYAEFLTFLSELQISSLLDVNLGDPTESTEKFGDYGGYILLSEYLTRLHTIQYSMSITRYFTELYDRYSTEFNDKVLYLFEEKHPPSLADSISRQHYYETDDFQIGNSFKFDLCYLHHSELYTERLEDMKYLRNICTWIIFDGIFDNDREEYVQIWKLMKTIRPDNNINEFLPSPATASLMTTAKVSIDGSLASDSGEANAAERRYVGIGVLRNKH